MKYGKWSPEQVAKIKELVAADVTDPEVYLNMIGGGRTMSMIKQKANNMGLKIKKFKHVDLGLKEEKRILPLKKDVEGVKAKRSYHRKQDMFTKRIERAADVLGIKTETVTGQLTHDPVNHPSHYTQGSIETIEHLRDIMGPQGFESGCVFAALQYLCRYRHKNGVEDLKKAQWYLNKLIEVKA